MKFNEKHKNVLLKTWKICWQTVLILFITVLLFEGVYRSYWFDFYGPELNTLNPKDDLELRKERTLLVFGDSFTADPNGWVKVLRDSLADYNIINCAVPGTTVFHQQLFFEDRITTYNPDQIIIQLYVGNDLIDYNRPQNFSELPFFRNVFWWISDNLISLQYINYKLGRFKSSNGNQDPKLSESFNIDRYNSRVKNYILAEPAIFQESISPTVYFQNDFDQLKEDLIAMINSVTPDIELQIMIVPMALQTSDTQLKNFLALDAILDTTVINDFKFFSAIKALEDTYANLYVWSPLKAFQQSQEEFYYLNDPHLNPSGQFLLGTIALQHFEKTKN